MTGAGRSWPTCLAHPLPRPAEAPMPATGMAAQGRDAMGRGEVRVMTCGRPVAGQRMHRPGARARWCRDVTRRWRAGLPFGMPSALRSPAWTGGAGVDTDSPASRLAGLMQSRSPGRTTDRTRQRSSVRAGGIDLLHLGAGKVLSSQANTGDATARIRWTPS